MVGGFPLQSLTQKRKTMNNNQTISKEIFMSFFRDSEKLSELTSVDRIEILRTIFLGSSDLTKDLLTDILNDYSVENIEVIELNSSERLFK